MNNKLKCAHELLEKGYSVVAISPLNKTPLWPWLRYTKEKAEKTLLDRWWTIQPDANVAIITGKISGIFAVDLDIISNRYNMGGYFKGDIIAQTSTPNDGKHIFYKYGYMDQFFLDHEELLWAVNSNIFSDQRYIVVPPSILLEGEYTWDKPL